MMEMPCHGQGADGEQDAVEGRGGQCAGSVPVAVIAGVAGTTIDRAPGAGSRDVC